MSCRAATGAGYVGVEDGPLRRLDRNRLKGPLIAWAVGIERAFDWICRVGIGVLHDRIDAARDLFRGPLEIKLDVRATDGQPALDVGFIFIDPVRFDRGGPGPVRQRRDRLAHGGLGTAAQLRRELGQIGEIGVVEELLQASLANPLRRDLGIEVTNHLIGHADVCANDVSYELVLLIVLNELDRHQAQALLEQLARITGPTGTADVGQMRDRAGEADELAAVKNRRCHGDVGKMARAEPGVVGDDAIVGPPAFDRDSSQHRLDGTRHHADEGWNTSGVLGQAIAFGVQQHRREVVRLPNQRRERRPQQRPRQTRRRSRSGATTGSPGSRDRSVGLVFRSR